MKDRGSPPAKITRPVFSGVIPRKRLFRLLDKGVDKPLIWISGPAGSGKTTLVGSYLDARKLPCLWYRFDERDSDIATFFYYMGLAGQELAPRRKPLPLLTPEYLMGIPTFTKCFFENLCERMKPPYMIVFDNYQDVSVSSSFHEMIVHSLDVVTEGITVFIISRTESPQQFSRLRANNRMHFLGWKDIRLDLPEAQDITRKILGGGGVAAKDLTDIYDRTSGWVAGLVLLIESLKRDSVYHNMPEKRSREEIFEYFANEIFDRLEAALKLFLLRTAFLTKISSSLAEQLTGNADADQLLQKLSSGNYFTERHLQADSVYIYHPLFREFLLLRARTYMKPEEIRDIQLAAARLLSANGQIEDAAEIFIEAGDMEGLVQLIMKEARSLVLQGRFPTLEGWIDSVPWEMRDSVPWLHFWKGVCRQTFDMLESRTHFERAFHLFESQGDTEGTFLSWSNVVDSIILERNNFNLLDDWMDWIETYIRNHGGFPSLEIETQVATSMAGAYTWRRPGSIECRKWVDRSLQLASGDADIGIQMKAFSHALMYFGMMSNFARVSEIINEVEKLISVQGAPHFISILIKCYEAMGYLFSVEYYEKALKSILKGMDIAEKTGVHILDNYLYSTGIYVYLCMGNMDKAMECFESLRLAVRADRITNSAQFHDLAAWLHLLSGDVPMALHHAKLSVTLNAASGAVFPEFLSRYVAAITLHVLGEFEKADKMLSEAAEISQKTDSPVCIFQCLLVKAEFAFNRGNESEGRSVLSKALAIGREHDFITISYLWRTSVLSGLFSKALESGIETEYVKRFIKKCRLLPDDKSLDSEHWPRPIKVYTLGRFSILKNDESVKFSRKVQQKPLFLLKALIALGGRHVHEERLIDALWPESAGDVAHISLRTTVHRLRKLLENEDAVQFSDDRIGLDPRYCWVDIWSFLRTAGEAEGLWKKEHCGKVLDSDHASAAIGISEKAVNLYKGDFLCGDTKHPWAFSMRERLKDKFIRLISRVGECYEHFEKWDEAIECYRRALEKDSLQEGFYQKIMVCYQRSGRRSEAMATYKRCLNELSLALGIEPSLVTERIYEALLIEDR